MKEGKNIFLYDSCLKTRRVDSKLLHFELTLFLRSLLSNVSLYLFQYNNAKTARNDSLHVLYLRVAIYCLQGKSTKAFEQKR